MHRGCPSCPPATPKRRPSWWPKKPPTTSLLVFDPAPGERHAHPSSAHRRVRQDLRPQSQPHSAPAPAARPGPFNRSVDAAAHVVVDPWATVDPWDAAPVIDWDSTLAFREHLYRLGFKVAEAMDTAQRGMGLDWPVARELIQRSIGHARAVGGELACGVGT